MSTPRPSAAAVRQTVPTQASMAESDKNILRRHCFRPNSCHGEFAREELSCKWYVCIVEVGWGGLAKALDVQSFSLVSLGPGEGLQMGYGIWKEVLKLSVLCSYHIPLKSAHVVENGH